MFKGVIPNPNNAMIILALRHSHCYFYLTVMAEPISFPFHTVKGLDISKPSPTRCKIQDLSPHVPLSSSASRLSISALQAPSMEASSSKHHSSRGASSPLLTSTPATYEELIPKWGIILPPWDRKKIVLWEKLKEDARSRLKIGGLELKIYVING